MRLTRVTLIVLISIIGIGFYQMIQFLTEDVDMQALQSVEEVMVDSSHLLAGVVEKELEAGNSLETGIEQLQQSIESIKDHHVFSKIYQREKQSIGLGVYVTNRNGIVIYDSDEGTREGMDFSPFNDVRLTLLGRYGARSSRVDESKANSSVMYVAAPVVYNDEVVASLTVFKPQEDIREFVDARSQKLVWVIALTGVSIISLCAAVLVWVYRPIGTLTQYAESVAAGERLPLPHLGKGKEVNTLGKALFQMRETLEGRKYVENYVSSLTHELKSPLAGIKGAAELLQEQGMPREKKQTFLRNIEREVTRSESLVKDLLSLSQIEGMQHLDTMEKVDVRGWVESVVSELEPTTAEKTLDIKVHSSLEVFVIGDRKILNLALLHVLQNAISFSESEGKIDISWALQTSGEKQSVCLSLRDEGSGLPDYAEGRVFDHFYSLPRPNGASKSTGLGLPLVREAMHLHGGEVSLKNRTNHRGCIVQLVLPAV